MDVHRARRAFQRLIRVGVVRPSVLIGVVLTVLVLAILWVTVGLRQAQDATADLIPVIVQPIERRDPAMLVLQEREGGRQLNLEVTRIEASIVASHQGVRLGGEDLQVMS